MKRVTTCIALALAVSIPLAPAAAEENFYLGIAAAFSHDDIGQAGTYGTPADRTSVSVDDKGDGLKAYGGWSVSPYFALEAGYTDLGKLSRYSSHTTPSSNDTLNEERSVWTIDLSAIGSLPIGEMFSFYARAGAALWTAELREVTAGTHGYLSKTQESNGVSPMAGAGIAFRFVRQGSVRVEYQRYFRIGGALRDDGLGGNDVGRKSDLDLISISAQYHF